MKFTIGYGKGQKQFVIEDKNLLACVIPNVVTTEVSGEQAVKLSLENPVASKRLSEIVQKGETVAIITSDITRPVPSKIILSYVIDELVRGGVNKNDITVVFALGSHRKHTEEEKRYLVGDKVYESVRCIDSDANDCVHCGTTSSGTPVDIFRVVLEADRRVCVGNIDYHYFAGYSGGAKAIMPGVSTREAIQANHKMMVMEGAVAGAIEGNPVRQDIEEAAKFLPIDFIVNVVLDEKKSIVKSVAGHYIEAHRDGCRFLDNMYKVKIPRRADIVVTTPGGYPKDINLYQAQKAIDNAKYAVRDGGIMIFIGSCAEGFGESVFEKWMMEAGSKEDLISRVKTNFELGGHKAAAIALVLSKVKIFAVTDLEPEIIEKSFMQHFESVEKALDAAYKELGRDAEVLVIPYGGSVLPGA